MLYKKRKLEKTTLQGRIEQKIRLPIFQDHQPPESLSPPTNPQPHGMHKIEDYGLKAVTDA
jgi:hypothetical protein